LDLGKDRPLTSELKGIGVPLIESVSA